MPGAGFQNVGGCIFAVPCDVVGDRWIKFQSSFALKFQTQFQSSFALTMTKNSPSRSKASKNPLYILTPNLSLLKNLLLFSMAFEIFYEWYGCRLKKQQNIWSLTGAELGFFPDSPYTYKDLPFELLKLDLCANVMIGRK